MIADNDAYIDAFGYVNPTMMMVDPNNSGNVYICQKGQTVGNIHKSTDGGVTWAGTELLPDNSPVWSMAINASDSNIIYVSRNDKGDTTYRGVVKTTDGGSSWTSAGLSDQVIGLVVMASDNENVLYAGTEEATVEVSAKLYKTIDGGNNWTDITPSGSSGYFVAIAIDSSDSNIVYAGTESGYLYKSTDGSSNWTLLTNAFISVKTLMIGSLYAGTGGGLYKYSPDTSSPDTSSSGSSSGCFIDTVR